jgi:hypothetical protein
VCSCLFRTLDISLPRNAPAAAAAAAGKPAPHPAVLRGIDGLDRLRGEDEVQPVRA